MSIVSIAFKWIVPALLAQQRATTLPAARNPILPGADPDAVIVGDAVWIYPTFSPGSAPAFFAFSSRDLVAWQRHGPILRFADVAWIDADGQKNHGAWAPSVAIRDGKFYLYYAVGDQNVTVSRIGVAVADAPDGPFVDSGAPMPIVGARGVFEAIDPMVFTDPADGHAYLYAGGSDGSTLRVFRLKADMVSIDREISIDQPEHFTEGPFMHARDGVYYLSYSHGNYRDHTYSVHYSTAPSPAGPWHYRGAILTSDATHKGPGHHAFFKNGASGRWYVVYHRYDHQTGDGPYRAARQVCIDRLDYEADGAIRPIVMTDTGVPAERFGK